MPQIVDLEALVCCGEGKVACETLANAPEPEEAPASLPPSQPQGDPDQPADSFRLPLEDVLDWISRNAAATPYDFDGSTRGAAYPKSGATPHHQKKHVGGGTGAKHRYARTKRHILGLPNKIRNSAAYLGQSARRGTVSARFFPKGESGSFGSKRSAATTTLEPTSPKVSCLGRVLADQDYCRRASSTVGVSRGPSSVSSAVQKERITGFWGIFLVLSCFKRQPDEAFVGAEPVCTPDASQAATPKGTSAEAAQVPRETMTGPPVPGLGGMMRLSSGRRAASWGSNLKLEQIVEDATMSPRLSFRQEVLSPGQRLVGTLADLDGNKYGKAGVSTSI